MRELSDAEKQQLEQHRAQQQRIAELEAEVSALKQKNMALEAQLDYVSIECPDCEGTGVLGLAKDGRWVPCETCGGHDERLGFGRVPHG